MTLDRFSECAAVVLGKIEVIEPELRRRWEQRRYKAFAKLYSQSVAVWCNLKSKPTLGVCVHDGNDAPVEIDGIPITPAVIAKNAKQGNTAFLEHLLKVLRRVHAEA